ncbi:hypothetical protein [Corynebacterium terpenotabidum]|uniref:DUF3037 domain-containing protein n=1 Tax=Corynebacterium terpenotabidum Y-11 TaxID=1200352 RepID=S4XHN3_9CORY|nr:hypothetical protein [Corynebacterium terpenotabidum]AGP31190.1 hypothetical protein A606_07715 [Corynebacterium terpenotabidum Y-11]
MRYRYWTIQVTPDSMRLLTFGVGVLVLEEETGRHVLRTIPRHDALPASTGSDESIRNGIDFLRDELQGADSRPGGLRLAGVETLSSLADHMVHHWNNFITVDAPRYAAAESLEAAVELLYGMFVAVPSRTRSKAPIYALKDSINQAYTARPELKRALRQSPELQAGPVDGSLDLALVGEGDRVVELNSSFSFLQSNPTETRRTILAWNYGIDKLRERGGVLTIPPRRGQSETLQELELPDNAPVVVTYDPPETKRQREVFSSVREQWEELDVLAVPRSDVPAHVERVATRLRSA